jgi:hypothetical protein
MNQPKRKRRLTTRPAPTGGGVVLSEPQTEEQVITFMSNPRNGFTCGNGSGKSIVSLDYSSQEILVATVLSKDPAMTQAQLLPKKLALPDGTTYTNPRGDLHSWTCSNCTHPHLVEGKPESEWDEIVRKLQPGEKRKPRDTAKTLNFAK